MTLSKLNKFGSVLVFALAGSTFGCAQDYCSDEAASDCSACVEPGGDDFSALQTAFTEASDGDVVCLAPGTFEINDELRASKNDMTIRGAGMDSTVLDFSDQDSGANGMALTGDGMTVQDFQVINTPGDGIRADQVDGITYRSIKVDWDDPDPVEHGAYGIYPVGCDDVLVEDTVVIGARDAGIYVGQSNDIVVKDSEAHGNVAGVEIENSFDAKVHDNFAHENTAGILVFNLPGLEQNTGARTEVFDNLIEDNNIDNFAPGGTVAQVPRGTGVLLLAAQAVDIHHNEIKDNGGPGAIIVKYEGAVFGDYDDPGFDPFVRGVWIHENEFSNTGFNPDDWVWELTGMPNTIPEIVWGGCLEDGDNVPEAERICVSDNSSADHDGPLTYVNFKLCEGFSDQVHDITEVTCANQGLVD